MEEILHTPLEAEHAKLGARMVPFAGWNMPVQYKEGILNEHHHTRKEVSIFDICHMGEFRVIGQNAAQELDACLGRAVADQKVGTCRYNFLLTEQGTVIDDLIVYRISEEEFFIVVNAGTKDGDAAKFQERLSAEIKFTDESAQTAKIDLQGPKSVNVLESIGFKKEELPTYYRWIKTEINSIPCLLSRTGYTGELGFELYFAAEKAPEMWNFLLSQENVKPAGLGARDTLRLECGYALYGHELNLETTPIEAGYGFMLKLAESDRKFIGSEALRNSPPAKKLVAIELEGRRAAREGAVICVNGNEAGQITSGAFGPSLEKAIAIGYINSGFDTEPGTKVSMKAGRADLEGQIVKLPFYKEGSARIKF